VSESKSPVDTILDLFLYAPLGFAMEARKLLPDMIERGRQQVNGQIGMAKVVGQFAVKQGQVEAGKAVSNAQKQAETVLGNLGVGGRPATSPAPSPSKAATPPAAPTATPTAAATTPSTAASPPAPEAAAPSPSVDAGTLAIPDYDSLSASQVVPRLAGLSTDELEAVRSYEAGHRGRKTILNRVAQLQAG
jgi:hypothetical protein